MYRSWRHQKGVGESRELERESLVLGCPRAVTPGHGSYFIRVQIPRICIEEYGVTRVEWGPERTSSRELSPYGGETEAQGYRTQNSSGHYREADNTAWQILLPPTLHTAQYAVTELTRALLACSSFSWWVTGESSAQLIPPSVQENRLHPESTEMGRRCTLFLS